MKQYMRNLGRPTVKLITVLFEHKISQLYVHCTCFKNMPTEKKILHFDFNRISLLSPFCINGK